MTTRTTSFTTALRFVLAAHVRNRLALFLAVAFPLVWIFLTRTYGYHVTLHFQVFPAGGYINADNNRTMQLNSAMNAVTVTTGFMTFMETLKSGPLDRRLVLAGYRRHHLMAAKVAALLVIAAALAAYTVLLLRLSFHQEQMGALALAFFTANAAFGGIGIMLGTLLRGELEGFFAIIMTSIIDNGLQNPGMNPPADQPGLRLLPLHGPSQAAWASAFTEAWPGAYAVRGLVWFALTATAGLLIFNRRTRSHHRPRPHSTSARLPAQAPGSGAAAGTVAGARPAHERIEAHPAAGPGGDSEPGTGPAANTGTAGAERARTWPPAGPQGDGTHETIATQDRQTAAMLCSGNPLPGLRRHNAAPNSQSGTPEKQSGYTAKTLERDIGLLYPVLPHPATARDLMTTVRTESLLPHSTRRLQQRLHTGLIAPVRETVEHGGRRWRPTLAAAVAEALGADSRPYGPLWAACELLHTGSLIIDDIQDQAPLRRGRPCTHLVHGSATAINAGTAAYFAMHRAIQHALPEDPRLRSTVYEVYLDALQAAHCGQALDLQGHHEEMTSALETGDTRVLKQLVTVTHRLKSGVPVGAAFRIAAVVATASVPQCEAVAALGEAVGTAYQITDDIADLRCVSRQGTATKRVAEDLLNAKVTYPLVHALARLPHDEACRLWHQVRSGLDPDDAVRAARRITECGALETCADEADRMVHDAWAQASAVLPQSPATESLGRICAEALRSRVA
ncbi:polyprenyl synthetase family protein [Streptomyces sp. NPDC032940]|uniref:polyprenyl synthetase family protein n=1 Tax=Streptomyces sp. NPDC032940 TaxID=3155366 RepID=UPI0033E42C4D